MILSKAYDPADLAEALPELEIVDRHWASASPQHPARRWEYMMALTAFKEWWWRRGGRPAKNIVDVGGAGSPFAKMADASIIDPALPNNYTLADYVTAGTELSDVVFCISVIEHVDDLDQFLYHLSCLVAPGGLLFLTMDYQPDEGKDDKHFHWMRKRIFSPYALGTISGQLFRYDFRVLGEANWEWHGPIEPDWGYSFASLALVKRA